MHEVFENATLMIERDRLNWLRQRLFGFEQLDADKYEDVEATILRRQKSGPLRVEYVVRFDDLALPVFAFLNFSLEDSNGVDEA